MMTTANSTTANKAARKPTKKQLTERLIKISLEAATIKRQLTGLALPDQDEDIALVYECFADEVRSSVENGYKCLNEEFNLLFNNTL